MKLTQTTHNLKTLNNNTKTLDFKVKYKTERCRYWEQQQSCPFGEMCAFIHIENEKREKEQIHEHYKTKTCLNFSKEGYCKYGDRCLFLHEEIDCSRTRSSSPVSPVHKNKKHGENLKMLEEFGFCIFEAHMNRQFSKINHSDLFVLEDDCNNISISTEFSDEEDQNSFNEDFVIERYIINENKKIRMYSL